MTSVQLPSARVNVHPADHRLSTLPTKAFDVICIGTGWASRVAAARIVAAGFSAAVIEDELVGGDCPFWACVPSKVLLRPSSSTSGVISEADVSATFARRNKFTGNFSDAPVLIPIVEGAGVTIVRGRGSLAGKKSVTVTAHTGEQVRLEAKMAVVLGVGSSPIYPDIAGLAGANVWTPRDATSSQTVPEHLVVIGAGAVGAEMATAYASFGSKVTLVSSAGEILPSVDAEAGKIVREAMTVSGVDVRVENAVTAVERGEDGKVVVTLADGDEIHASEVLLAAGRRGNHDGLNLESVGAVAAGSWIPVNDDLLVQTDDGEEWLYAAGDVNGRALLTHTSKYHGRVIANGILARKKGPVSSPQDKYGPTTATADIHAVPQVIFTNPPVASVGLTRRAAAARGVAVREVTAPFVSLGGRIASDNATEGWAQWLLDAEGRLVGATFVGDGAGDVLHASTVAIVGQMTIERLAHAIPAFPTISEVYLNLLESAGL